MSYRPHDVISPKTEYKCTRLRGAQQGTSVCQYCAVGCTQLAFFKDKKLIDVEGDPRSPVNEGRLCPKGGSTFGLNENTYRRNTPLYRAPGSDHWEEVSLDWMVEQVAKRVWDTRAEGFVATDEETGITVNNVDNIGFIGGSANDNEECYMIRKLFSGGLGILPVENTARYCHSTTVTALAPTFGFGACTNPPRDLIHSDCIFIMGSNMSECHPVAFHWPMEAKKKGAVTIHVDPRYTRTSGACDHYVHVRPGTDIAFLNGVIRYILEKDLWFHEYVVAYTNAATLIDERFNFNQETGLFNGWDPSTNSYAFETDSWDYQYEMNEDGSRGAPKTDPTLQDPHCVFQLLKTQVEKYTPETVASICGCRPEDIIKVAELMGRNSGRDRTTAFCYATGFTQHSSGTQIIRTAAILQLLLGNIGRPGGGILALRGHSNVQGATDVPTLWNNFPNYIPQPLVHPANATLKDYLANGHGFSGARDKKDGMWKLEAERGAWASLPAYMVSLLKAWYGDAATPENEFGYQWLPKLFGNQSLSVTMERCMRGEIKGLLVFGQNIAISNPNTNWSRHAIRNLDWLVVCDIFETETAAVWYADPTGPKPSECKTEVFYLPTCTALEKDGSFTNTERLLQWHDRIKEAPGLCRSDGWWVYQLGLKFKEYAEKSGEARDEAMRALTWDYASIAPTKMETELGLCEVPGEPDMAAVSLEMNGYEIATGKICQGSGDLKADGSTLCGCRLLSGYMTPDGENRMTRVDTGTINNGSIFPDFRYAWPLNSRILYNRCSADPEGKPWSERKKLIWWDEEKQEWVGYDHPNFDVHKPPTYVPLAGAKGGAALSGAEPFTVHSDGKAWIFVPYGIKEGPLTAHYETTESPYKNILWKQTHDPGLLVIDDPLNRIDPTADKEFPTVLTTYHLVEHWLSGAQTRNTPWLVGLQPQTFIEISPELADYLGVDTGDYVKVYNERFTIHIPCLVTPRLRIGYVEGRPGHIAGLYDSSGYMGLMTSEITNDLSPAIMSPDGLIPASKGFTVRIAKADPADVKEIPSFPLEYAKSFDEDVPDTPWPSQPESRN